MGTSIKGGVGSIYIYIYISVVSIPKKERMHCLPKKNYSAENEKYIKEVEHVYFRCIKEHFREIQWIYSYCNEHEKLVNRNLPLKICTSDMHKFNL